MSSNYRHIAPEIKASILKQIKEDFRPVKEVAETFGVSAKTIYSWLRTEVEGTGKTDSQFLTEYNGSKSRTKFHGRLRQYECWDE